ncbi:hypothetical protein KST17_05205 [Fusobacterium canifelinum]|uniref:hypothetical protein n=1 Tax=Fusobacterium canifelinum TaxID=285729 RepID=UPI0030D24A6D
MENYGKAKKVVGMKLIVKILILSCFLLFTFFLFSVTKFFIKDFERGYSVTGGKYLMLVIIAEIVLIFFAFGLPYLILKLYPKIYYYDDGFQVGKKNGKIFYEKLDYFFIPAYNRVNSFMAIRYTDNEGNWKAIPAINYARHSFDLFQQDFVNINFPKVMKKLENNEVVEFLFNNPKKRLMAWGSKKYMKKKLEQALKIRVTRESITFDDETYEWDKYKIFTSLGSIVVQEKDGTPILVLGGNALIHRVNLLEAIINTFGKN